MSTTSTMDAAARAGRAPYERIVDGGEIMRFNSFPDKNETVAFARETLLEAARRCTGPEAAAHIDRAGLDQYHKFVPADYLPFINRFLTKSDLKRRFLILVARFGREILQIPGEFFVDDAVIFRVHFPYEVGRNSKMQRAVYRAIDLDNIDNAREEVEKAWNEHRNDELPSAEQAAVQYHSNLPVPAWSHGPHKDTWFGHTFDAMNLWWSLSAVTEKTGVIFYPELFGLNFPHLKKPAYIAPGTPLPKPQKTAMDDGDMLVFNSDQLHATHLNITDRTRIVLTGRINPKKPAFYRHTMEAEYPHWHHASDLIGGRADRILEFRRRENFGTSARPAYRRRLIVQKEIAINRRLADETSVPVCHADDLKVGEKCLVRFEDIQVIVARTATGWRAVSAACPHNGINLIDGFNDDDTIYCPGHGVAFDLRTGRSDCALLKLRVFRVSVDPSNEVILHRSAVAGT